MTKVEWEALVRELFADELAVAERRQARRRHLSTAQDGSSVGRRLEAGFALLRQGDSSIE